MPEEDRILEVVLDAGADDLTVEGDHWRVLTPPQALQAVRDVLEAANVPVASAELSMVPEATIPLQGGDARRTLALVEALDELDDVQAVHANFDIPDEVLAEVAG